MPSKTTSLHIACLSAALALLPCAALAQQDAGQSSLSTGDRKFLTSALEGDMAEVQLGKLALQKSSNADVKSFAQKIVDDHTKLDEQVKPVAQQVGVNAPSQPSPKAQALMTRLQSLDGAQFDKAYARAMVMDHREDDRAFKKEETSGKNQAVKDLATQGEPTIAEHLQLAQELEKKVQSGDSSAQQGSGSSAQ